MEPPVLLRALLKPPITLCFPTLVNLFDRFRPPLRPHKTLNGIKRSDTEGFGWGIGINPADLVNQDILKVMMARMIGGMRVHRVLPVVPRYLRAEVKVVG